MRSPRASSASRPQDRACRHSGPSPPGGRPRGAAPRPRPTGRALPAQRPVTVDRAAAERAVGPVPPPVAAAALADSLGRSSHRLLTALRMAAPIVAGIAAAPFLLAGAALAALAAGLDPIVFGVIPAGPPMQGQPAAWYI